MNKTKATNLQVVELNHHKFAVELLSGNVCVNLTQLAKPFGKAKQPSNWLKTDESKEYLETISVPLKVGTADLVKVRQGGTPGNQGTWCFDRRIAIRFAQWLSPAFAIAVDDLILKLLTKQAVLADNFNGVEPVIHGGQLWYNYLDVLESLGYSRRSGSVAVRKRLFPQCFAKLFGRNFVNFDFCRFLRNRRDAYQLTLDFVGANNPLPQPHFSPAFYYI